jgi:DNA polymerase elongation subunit (family B)
METESKSIEKSDNERNDKEKDYESEHVSCFDYAKVIKTRKEYLNPNECKVVDNILKEQKEIYFLPTYVHEMAQNPFSDFYEPDYKILLTGVFQDGQRATFVLDGILPYYEIRLDNFKMETSDTGINDVRQVGKNIPLTDHTERMANFILASTCQSVPTVNRYNGKERKVNIKPKCYEIIKAKPFLLYQEEESTYIRLYYKDTFAKNASINYFKKTYHTISTTHDDISHYHRVVCRDLLTTFSTWSAVQNYHAAECKNIQGDVYRVRIFDSDMCPTENYKKLVNIPDSLKREKTISMSWDIETYSSKGFGYIPKQENKEDSIVCIALNFQFVSSNKSFLRVGLSVFPAASCGDTVILVCSTEKRMLNVFSYIINRINPEIIQGFNDSDYDWPWVVQRALSYQEPIGYMFDNMSLVKSYKTMPPNEIVDRYYKSYSFKLEAGRNAEGTTLSFPGYIAVDVRTVFRKIYATAEYSSLKFYLEENKLGGKEDMPIVKLFDICRRMFTFMEKIDYDKQVNSKNFKKYIANPKVPDEYKDEYQSLCKEMGDVIFYCDVDAEKCHELMKIRNIIMDHREVADISYCNMYDTFYYADNSRVRNLTIAIGQHWPYNVRFSNYIEGDSIKDKTKYIGAYVIPPKTGNRVSKNNLDEIMKKLEYYKNNPNRNEFNKISEWNNTTEDEIKEFKNLIVRYGAHATPTQITEIEKDLGRALPNKFKKFLSEEINRPIAGLDFSSLYPSLIRTYNLSPELCIKDPGDDNDKTELLLLKFKQKHRDAKLTRIEFDYSGTKKLAFFIHHDYVYDPKQPNFKFGIYPYILDGLFRQRKAVKKYLEEYKVEKEKLATDKKFDQHYEDVCFNFNYYNAKQSAIKVFMNTFYGICGSKQSPFFLLEVAAGTTTKGRESLQQAARWVTELGCKIYYGDTDSVYISMPDKHFDELDRRYYSGQMNKLDYWHELVKLSFDIMKDKKIIDEETKEHKTIMGLASQINKKFKEMTNTDFLSMAYEEFLWPVLFAARKKYIGAKHEKEIDFFPKEGYFTRGFEVKKRGTSTFLRKIFDGMTKQMFHPENTLSALELALDTIDAVYKNAALYEFADFKLTANYAPTKKNVKVITFVERMKDTQTPVKPGERFEYVMVKKYPYRYDIRGRQIALSAGERMEYLTSALSNNMQIDFDYYMEGSVNGQIARLIAFEEIFRLEKPEGTSADDAKVIDKKIYDNAVKFVDNYAKKYYSQYHKIGGAYKSIYTKVSKKLKEELQYTNQNLSELLSGNLEEDTKKTHWISAKAEKAAKKDVRLAKYGKLFVEDALEDCETKQERKDKIIQLQNTYYNDRNINNLQRVATNKHRGDMVQINNQIILLQRKIEKFYNFHNALLQNIIDEHKKSINIPREYTEQIKEGEEAQTIKFDISEVKINVKPYIREITNNETIRKILDNIEEIYNEAYNAWLDLEEVKSIVKYLQVNIRDKGKKYVYIPEEERDEELTKISSDLDVKIY